MRILTLILALLCANLAYANAEYIASPDIPVPVNLSSSNPNHFRCTDGSIEDIVFPGHIPLAADTKGRDAFISYKILENAAGETRHFGNIHDLYVICNQNIYTFNVIPKKGLPGSLIRLGDPNLKYLEKNIEIVKEKGIENTYVHLILTAHNNDYEGNINVEAKNENYSHLFQDLQVTKLRELTMMGSGIRLLEFVIKGRPGTSVNTVRFLKKELSDSMLSVAVHPPKTLSKQGFARLYIVENAL